MLTKPLNLFRADASKLTLEIDSLMIFSTAVAHPRPKIAQNGIFFPCDPDGGALDMNGKDHSTVSSNAITRWGEHPPPEEDGVTEALLDDTAATPFTMNEELNFLPFLNLLIFPVHPSCDHLPAAYRLFAPYLSLVFVLNIHSVHALGRPEAPQGAPARKRREERPTGPQPWSIAVVRG